MCMGDWRPFVYGGLASMAAECGTFPIDLTKTRLQIQGQKIDARHADLKYRGMSHAFVRIFREEGTAALYSGISPALLRQATYGTIKIGIYYSMKKIIMPEPADETLHGSVLCGIVAGVISSSIANPTDVLKVRMQAKNESFVKQGMMTSFADMFKQEGLRGMWRGVGPTAQRAAVIAGVELPVYDICKKYLVTSGYMNENALTHFVASFVAGLAGAIASTPIDVVKTRMMNQRNMKVNPTGGAAAGSNVIYKSSMDCILHTIRNEGPLALYKGFIPTWVRLGPWNIIFFITYEQLKILH